MRTCALLETSIQQIGVESMLENSSGRRLNSCPQVLRNDTSPGATKGGKLCADRLQRRCSKVTHIGLVSYLEPHNAGFARKEVKGQTKEGESWYTQCFFSFRYNYLACLKKNSNDLRR